MNIIARVLIVVFVGLLAACENGVMGPTQYDFQQVKSGMTREQVHNLLGQPDRVDKAGLNGMTGATETWVGNKHSLSVTFVDGKVRLTDIEPLGKQKSGQAGEAAG